MAFAAPRRPIGARALLPPPPRILEPRPSDCPRGLGLRRSLAFGCSTLGGFLYSCGSAQSACLRAPGRSLSPASRLLLGPREPKTLKRCCPPYQQG